MSTRILIVNQILTIAAEFVNDSRILDLLYTGIDFKNAWPGIRTSEERNCESLYRAIIPQFVFCQITKYILLLLSRIKRNVQEA